MKKTLVLLGALAACQSLPLAQANDLQSSGSISIKDMKERQYPSAAKVTLQDAIGAALEKQKGKAVSADLDDEQGFLVYEVTIAAADGQKFDVYVDAGNKKILGVEKDDDFMG